MTSVNARRQPITARQIRLLARQHRLTLDKTALDSTSVASPLTTSSPIHTKAGRRKPLRSITQKIV